jgi:hypothetical protein
MTTLNAIISDLARSFAESILDTIRRTRLDEVLSESRDPRAGRALGGEAGTAGPKVAHDGVGQVQPATGSHSIIDLAKMVDLVAKLVKSHPNGLRSEQIGKTLGIDGRDGSRVLKRALMEERITARGKGRATTYHAA